MKRIRWGARRARALLAGLGVSLLASGPTAGAERAVAPGYRADVVISGLGYITDVVEASRGTLLVSAGAEAPGGRLVRFTVPEEASAPVDGRRGEALLWSRWPLGPIATYPFTGRIYVGVVERGEILQLPQLTLDLAVLARWEPEAFIVGLTAVHDFAFGPDSRLRVADGSRILEAPVYFTPPLDAARLRTVYRCVGTCQGVAVARNGDLHVLEADGPVGRAVRQGADGTVHVVAAGLPRPGEGLRVGPRGDLFFTSEAGLLHVTPLGRVVRVLPDLAGGARVSLDLDGDPLVTDRAGGMVLRLHPPSE